MLQAARDKDTVMDICSEAPEVPMVVRALTPDRNKGVCEKNTEDSSSLDTVPPTALGKTRFKERWQRGERDV